MQNTKTKKIGVDVGNYDVKTQHCKIASGYETYEKKPQITKHCLDYKGQYYVPDISKRMEYKKDKTENNQCIILTLFGISEELLYIAKNSGNDIQAELDSMDSIKLGIGLPPGHFNDLAKKTLEYYQNEFSDTVEYYYNDYHFKFTVETIRIFPQDFVAVFKNSKCETAKMKRYYIVGIGGGTVDVIPVINGSPDVNNCFSLKKGTREMYKYIAIKLKNELQLEDEEEIEDNLIEDVIIGEKTVLDGSIIEKINAYAEEYVERLINIDLKEKHKVNLGNYPSVFFGGGGLLLRQYIEQYVKNCEILEDVNANAKSYALCLD